MTRLQEQVAIVTGGTRGLGWAITQAYVREGATVVAASRSGKPQEPDALDLQPGRLVPDQVDVTDTASVASLISRTVQTFGHVDVLVANAGVSNDGTLATIEPERWAEMLATNLTGTFNSIQAVVPYMRHRGGRIITISSSMATRPARGTAGYAATKAGIEALTLVAAAELGPYRILVNCLAPGILDAGMGAHLVKSKVWDRYSKRFALGRPGTVDEVARLAVILAMAESYYLNGTILQVHGGLSWS